MSLIRSGFRFYASPFVFVSGVVPAERGELPDGHLISATVASRFRLTSK
jgi:hypothetical protein